MKLPDDCHFEKLPLHQFPEAEIHRPNCCRAGAGFYLSEDEPPLCRFRETEPEAYRFFWKSSFNGDAIVHIARKGDSVRLRASRSSYSRLRLRVPLASVALSLNDWEKLQRTLTISDFWSLDATDENFGLDGARWLIEGRRGGIYHSVERWSPRGTLRDLGCVFFALAGSPLAEIELTRTSRTSEINR
jgi:hypothetical protein